MSQSRVRANVKSLHEARQALQRLSNSWEAHTHTGLEISNTPTGNIAATTVQGALNELDSEKEAAGTAATAVSTHAGLADPHTGYCLESVFGSSIGTSLSLAAGVLNAIQDIRTSAAPQFARLGLGVAADASIPLYVLCTTQQMQLGYDASNYATFTVSSAGILTEWAYQHNLYSSNTTKLQLGASGNDCLQVYCATSNNIVLQAHWSGGGGTTFLGIAPGLRVDHIAELNSAHTIIFDSTVNLSTLTASRLMASDGSKAVVSVTPGAHIDDATGDLADITTKFNTLLDRLEAIGALA